MSRRPQITSSDQSPMSRPNNRFAFIAANIPSLAGEKIRPLFESSRFPFSASSIFSHAGLGAELLKRERAADESEPTVTLVASLRVRM
jgi:hypothetical protein